jgi:hypothetical protein
MIYKKGTVGLPQSLLGLSVGPCRWPAGVATAVPLAGFTLTGHQSLGLIASLGAFTALYGSTLRLGDRLRPLPIVAIAFVTASTEGALRGTNVWSNTACLVPVAAVACAVVFRAGLARPVRCSSYLSPGSVLTWPVSCASTSPRLMF